MKMNDNEKINFLINSCKKNNYRFPHTLVVTEDCSVSEAFALDVASKLDRGIVTVSSEFVYRPSDLAGIVTNLKENDFLLIKDVDILNKECLYYFSGIMENFKLN